MNRGSEGREGHRKTAFTCEISLHCYTDGSDGAQQYQLQGLVILHIAMSSESVPSYRLYKLASSWGLPSASPACMRVEVSPALSLAAHSGRSYSCYSLVHMQAYSRLAKVDVAADECANSSTSPSGMHALSCHLIVLTKSWL